VAPATVPQPAKETAIVEKEAAVTATAVPAAPACQMDWQPTLAQVPKKYDPPVEIDAIFTTSAVFVNQDTYLDNAMTRMLRDNMGIEYTVHWQGEGDVATQKLAADVAAGTLPDYWAAAGGDLAEYIDSGICEDIKTIWEATASPLLKQKKGYATNRDLWRSVDKDGKLWGIGFNYGPAHHTDPIPYMRQDVREKLGLEQPETIEELTQTMKAMVESGMVKYGIFACKNLVTWYHSVDPIFGAFGVMPTAWVDGGDGTLRYDSISANAKQALEVLHGWYVDKLIDPDFYTYGLTGPDDSYQSMNDVVGCWFAPWWHMFYLVPLWEQHPGMRVERFPYPKGPDGKVGRRDSGFGGPALVFKKGLDPIKIEAMINEMNWHMEMHVNFEKYQQYGFGKDGQCFCEGLEWEWNGNCELERGPVEDSFRYLGYIGMDYPYLCYEDYQIDYFRPVVKWMENPAGLNKAQRWIIADQRTQLDAANYSYVTETQDTKIRSRYKGQPTERMRELLPDLQTLEDTTYIGIVTGDLGLDEFDNFVAKWKETGGDEVTAEVNNWYRDNKSA